MSNPIPVIVPSRYRVISNAVALLEGQLGTPHEVLSHVYSEGLKVGFEAGAQAEADRAANERETTA